MDFDDDFDHFFDDAELLFIDEAELCFTETSELVSIDDVALLKAFSLLDMPADCVRDSLNEETDS